MSEDRKIEIVARAMFGIAPQPRTGASMQEVSVLLAQAAIQALTDAGYEIIHLDDPVPSDGRTVRDALALVKRGDHAPVVVIDGKIFR